MRISDWSSDVCSSDLAMELDADGIEAVEERYFALQDMARKHHRPVDALPALRDALAQRLAAIDGGEAALPGLAEAAAARSEERRGGKECAGRVDLGGRRFIQKKNQE